MTVPPDTIGVGADLARADAIALGAFLADVRRRVRMREIARAARAAAGLLLGALLVMWLAGASAETSADARTGLVSMRAGLAVAAVIAGLGFAVWLVTRASRWRETALLPLVESRQPSFRNLLVTARELTRYPDRAGPAIRERVLRDAARVAHLTPLDLIVPAQDTTRALRQTAIVLLGAGLMGLVASQWPRGLHGVASSTADGRGTRDAAPDVPASVTRGIRAVTATVTPPAYTGRPAIVLLDPARIEAMAGSRLRLDVEVAGGGAQVAFNDRPHALTPIAGDGDDRPPTLAPIAGDSDDRPHTRAPIGGNSDRPAQKLAPNTGGGDDRLHTLAPVAGDGDGDGDGDDRVHPRAPIAAADGRTQPQKLAPNETRRLRAELVLTETGVLTVAARQDGSHGDHAEEDAPRLIAVMVTPDQAPTVEIVAPGRDLLFDDGSGHVPGRVQFVARARDDLGLRGLALRYTKVSGSGEQYEFHEGELPLAIARTDGQQWQGRLARSIRELDLNSGDLFVYYAVANDARGDEGRAVSDSYVIEIGKGGVAIAGGFAIPPDEDRFAISLNALIHKTERLHAKRAAMPAPEFADAALALAVEQRMVRTEFLFTMGFHGHVQDEEVEAAHSHEIQEGRLENRGQAEMVMATRLMTWAEQQLTAADTGEALKAMRGALAAIQRALSRHRYFLRTLLTTSAIDLTRRLTGDLSAATSPRWPTRDRTPDERLARIRAVLADLGHLTRGLEAFDGGRATSTGAVASASHAAAAAAPAPAPATPPRLSTRQPDAEAVPTPTSPAAAATPPRPSTRQPDAEAAATPAKPAAAATPAGSLTLGPDAARGETLSALAAIATTAAARVLTLDPTSATLQRASADLSQVARRLTATANGATANGATANTANAATDAARTNASARENLPLVRKATEAVLLLAGPAVATRDPFPRPPSDPSLRGAVVDALRDRGGPK